MTRNTFSCDCLMMDLLVDVPNYSVRRRDSDGAFLLFDAPIRFCMFCGGGLPLSETSAGPEPSLVDRQDALLILNSINSVDDLISTLGPPDELLTYEELSKTPLYLSLFKLADRNPNVGVHQYWIRIFRYRNRWDTLLLEVLERVDGSLAPSFYGQTCPTHEKEAWWIRWIPDWISFPNRALNRHTREPRDAEKVSDTNGT